jgi:outer membrane protein OmpA-like peptidoglycan-associated protein
MISTGKRRRLKIDTGAAPRWAAPRYTAKVNATVPSDRRAETVATLLTEMFGVPAENLTTQGYGEQDLKINTQEPEHQNRRVTIRRITPLLRNEARR